MSTVRAKFMCNEITLRATSVPNPAYEELRQELEQQFEGNVTASQLAEAAKERGISAYKLFRMPSVKLNPVYAPDDSNHENHKFWQASPSGEMTLTIANPDAAEFFDVSRTYYIDFTEAPA